MDRDLPLQLCQVCGYDMTGRAGGETCPECGSPLDTRPDDDRYIQAGYIGKVLLIWAIVLQLVLPPIALLLVVGAAFQLSKKHDAKNYRLSYRARRDRKHVNYLTCIWFCEFVAMAMIHELRRGWLFWLNW